MLHLAVAYDLMLCSWEGKLSAHELDLAQASFIGELLELAALVQPLLCADQRFGVTDDQMLTLEWVP